MLADDFLSAPTQTKQLKSNVSATVTCIQSFTGSSESHEQLADVLHVLQLAQLRQCVVSECFVQSSVAVLVGNVEVAALAHEQSHDLCVLAFHCEVQCRLQVHVLNVHVRLALNTRDAMYTYMYF